MPTIVIDQTGLPANGLINALNLPDGVYTAVVTATGPGGTATDTIVFAVCTTLWFNKFTHLTEDPNSTLTYTVDRTGNTFTDSQGYSYFYALSNPTGTAGQNDGLLVKVKPCGVVEWSKTVANVFNETVKGIYVASDTEIFATGSTSIDYPGFPGNYIGYDYLMKLDGEATEVWRKRYTRFGSVNVGTIKTPVRDTAGNLFTVMMDSSEAANDTYLVKLSSTGDVVWSKLIYGARGVIGRGDHLYVFGTEAASGFTMLGATHSFLLKFDTDGNIVWQRTIGGVTRSDNYLIVEGCTVAPDNGVFVVGSLATSSIGTGEGESAAFIAKIDSNGSISWQRKFGQPSGVGIDRSIATTSTATAVKTDSLGNAYVCGFTADTFENDDKVFVCKFLSDGSIDWYRRINMYRAWHIDVTADDMYVMLTFTSNSPTSNRSMFLAKLPTDRPLTGIYDEVSYSEYGVEVVETTEAFLTSFLQLTDYPNIAAENDVEFTFADGGPVPSTTYIEGCALQPGSSPPTVKASIVDPTTVLEGESVRLEWAATHSTEVQINIDGPTPITATVGTRGLQEFGPLTAGSYTVTFTANGPDGTDTAIESLTVVAHDFTGIEYDAWVVVHGGTFTGAERYVQSLARAKSVKFVDDAGNFYIAGHEAYYEGQVSNHYRPFISKVAPDGSLLWTAGFTLAGQPTLDAFVVKNNCVFAVLNLNQDAYLIKVDSDGTLLWQRRIAVSGDYVRFFAVDADDTTVYVGGLHDTGLNSLDVGYVTRWSQIDGSLLWQTSLRYSTGLGNLSKITCVKYVDGFLYCAGAATAPFTFYTGAGQLIVKLDVSDGSIVWQRGLNNNGVNLPTVNEIKCIDIDATGNIYIGGGWTYETSYLAKLDSSANIIWQKHIEILVSQPYQDVECLVVDSTGSHVYAVMDLALSGGTRYASAVMKLSAVDGSLDWCRRFDLTEGEYTTPVNIALDSTEQYFVLTGGISKWRYWGASADYRAFLVKYPVTGEHTNDFGQHSWQAYTPSNITNATFVSQTPEFTNFAISRTTSAGNLTAVTPPWIETIVSRLTTRDTPAQSIALSIKRNHFNIDGVGTAVNVDDNYTFYWRTTGSPSRIMMKVEGPENFTRYYNNTFYNVASGNGGFNAFDQSFYWHKQTGDYTLTAIALYDSNGTSVKATLPIHIVNPPVPTADITVSPLSVTAGTAPTITWSSAWATHGAFSITGPEVLTNSPIQPNGSVNKIFFNTVGLYSAQYTAYNEGASTSDSFTFYVVDPAQPPVIYGSFTSGPTVPDGTNVTLATTIVNATSASYLTTGPGTNQGNALAVPTGSILFNNNIDFTTAKLGNYNIQVDATGTGGTDQDNFAFTIEPFVIPDGPETALFSGVEVTGLSAGWQEALTFYIDVPAGEANLFIQTNAPEFNQAALLVRFGQKPTIYEYDYISNNQTSFGASENVEISPPAEGRYYITVFSFGFSNLSITATF